MKASTLTLTGALGLIPKVLFQRYGGSTNYTFAIAKANAILQDIEKEFDSDYYKKEYPLIIQDGITDYDVNENIRKVRGVYEVPAGWVIPDKRHTVSVDFLDTRLRLKHVPVANTTDDFSGTVTGNFAGNLAKFEDTVNLGSPVTSNKYKSALCRYTDISTGLTHNRIIASNDPTDDSITLNGNLPALPAASDTFDVITNYFIIEALDYITRVTDETAALPIPIDWEELVQAGLRFYYDKQTDQESNQTRSSGAEYSRLLKKASADEKRKQGDYPKQVPRDIPNFNKHDATTRFGPHSTSF